MKKPVSIFLALAILTGCSLPSTRARNSEAKVEAAKSAVANTQAKTVDNAREYVAGTGLALDRATPSPAVNTARAFNDRAQAVIGTPSMLQLTEVRSVVDGLLGENDALRKKAQATLDARDSTVSGLQAKIAGLEHTVAVAEHKQSGVLFDLAGLADHWSNLTRAFWAIVAFIAVVILAPLAFRLISVFAGPLGPVGNLFAVGAGKLGSAFINSVPKAAEYAGHVARSEFDAVRTTAEHLVSAVEKAKADPTAKAVLKDAITDSLDNVSQPVVDMLRRELKS